MKKHSFIFMVTFSQSRVTYDQYDCTVPVKRQCARHLLPLKNYCKMLKSHIPVVEVVLLVNNRGALTFTLNNCPVVAVPAAGCTACSTGSSMN